MDIQTQEKVSKLMIEQADKLGKALSALRRIRRLTLDTAEHGLLTATDIAGDTLREIAEYGKDPKSL